MSKSESIKVLNNAYKEKFVNEEVVLGDGNLDAAILLIGEAPGKEEVKQGRPFVGPAGKNLDEFLTFLLVKRDAIYVTNAIKHRLSKINPDTGNIINRPATKEEIANNRKYLIHEVGIIAPKVIVTLGNVPLRSILGDNSVNIGDFHGKLKCLSVDGRQYNIFPLYHPASIIYNQKLKEVYADDLEQLKLVLKEL